MIDVRSIRETVLVSARWTSGRSRSGRAATVAGPFEAHMRDAIALNAARAAHYAALSDGASLPLSRRLVRIETRLIPLARWLDRQARPYHEVGIPLLRAVFEPMSSAPPPGACEAIAIPSNHFAPLTATIRRNVRDAYRQAGFDGAARALEMELALLTRLPAVDCMVRHMLESARRVASLAPQHATMAQSRGLSSPEWISRVLLELHLLALPIAASLDADALAVQVTGVPILAADLPVITA